MFRRLDDFYDSCARCTDATKKIFSAMTVDSLDASVGEGHRTLRGMAWHIVTTIPEMMAHTGLEVKSVDSRALPPGTLGEILEAYDAATSELVAAVRAHWSDAELEATDELYGETWPRGLTLKVLMDHEIHHRGQMTVLMRQAGVAVPGVFGPSKEEWALFGMDAPLY